MREQILNQLYKMEEKEQIQILLAVESGSRGWGFESPDSDYDVRFIYTRRVSDYLKLEPVADVIEKPINNLLDIGGWDLKKGLRLIYNSNQTIFEWLSSPIVYIETPWVANLRELVGEYFSVKNATYHYLNMAKTNFRNYLKGEKVRSKKYLYVLRPILAAKWILENQSSPPMEFIELVEAMAPQSIKPTVETLLELKMQSPETTEIVRIDHLNQYLEKSIDEVQAKVSLLPKEPKKDWAPLDNIFTAKILE